MKKGDWTSNPSLPSSFSPLRPEDYHTVHIPIKGNLMSICFLLSWAMHATCYSVEWIFSTKAIPVSLLWLAIKTQARFLKTAQGSQLVSFLLICFWGGVTLEIDTFITFAPDRHTVTHNLPDRALEWKEIIRTTCVSKEVWNTPSIQGSLLYDTMRKSSRQTIPFRPALMSFIDHSWENWIFSINRV